LTIRLSRKRKRFFAGLLTATAVGLICCLISYFQLFHTLNQQSSDLLYQGQVSNYLTDTAQKIVIVAIDDSSLGELGRFSSWPRSFHTRLINTLSEDGARIIAFDILFSETSPDDEELAAAIKRAGNVILPYAGTTESKQTGEEEIIGPLRVFEESALATGHAYMIPDDDGVVRRLPLLIPHGDRYESSLALTTIANYLRRPRVFDSPPDEKHVTMAGREIPLQSYAMLINYTDKPSSVGFKTVPYADVLRGAVASDIFKDKIVIIGITALGFGDTYWTPMGQALSGVEIHAQAMNTILSGGFIKPASSSITYVSILLFALICGLATLRFRVVWSALSAVLLFVIYFLAAFYYFGQGLLLNTFYPPLSLVAIFLGVNLYNVTSERIEKREIAKTFGRYVSPTVATKILNTVNDGSLKLGGEESPVTVLFADARNFTGFCEKTSPQVLVSTLNRYLSVIIEAILQCDGMVNKFGGDSVMAVWNAPISCPEHALSATRAAVNAQQQISALQLKAPHLPKMEFGIGVNSGKAIVGNMGSLDRLEYSIIGDTVNTAARLSAVAPGGKVWIGSETFEHVKHQFEVIPLEPLALKGKGELINAYEVSFIKQTISDESQQALIETIKATV
jgi:adenylate cyclase